MPETIKKTIFLAGPSLRPGQEEINSWREDAIKILEDKGFNGTVFCPEPRDMEFSENFDYDKQILWEDKYLNLADCIVFWIPRDLSQDKNGNFKLPAFTTNIEWGHWADSGKVVYGAPADADKNNYIDFYAEQYNIEKANNLTELIDNALDFIAEGAERSGGDRFVPYFIWKLPSFQAWYKVHTQVGNKIEFARLLYTFRPKNENFVFLWILRTFMYIEAEGRVKKDEFVLARPNISSILLYKENESILDTQVVLVKEFRVAAANTDAFIRELPSGSGENASAFEQAAEELHEETGFYLDSKRLKFVKARQLAATLSSHKSYLYVVNISEEELKWFKSQDGIVHGNLEVGERTFIEVKTINELLESDELDWTNIGMIFSGIYSK